MVINSLQNNCSYETSKDTIQKLLYIAHYFSCLLSICTGGGGGGEEGEVIIYIQSMQMTVFQRDQNLC